MSDAAGKRHAPRPLDRHAPLPLWAQLAADLRRRIADDAFVDSFPTEADLVDDYDVSRHTVREALRRLRAEGLVVAERGRGSHLARRFHQPLGALYSLLESIESSGAVRRSEVRRLETVRSPRVAERLGVERDAELLVLERRRFADDVPLALDTAWLPAALATPLLDADFTRTALHDELATRCGLRVDGGEERITPIVPSAEERSLLDLADDVGAFLLDRTGRTGDRVVELRETVVRGDRYGFVASWSAARAYRLDLVAVR